MPTSCAVVTCTNYGKTTTNKNIIYHRFPKNINLQKVWVKKCRRQSDFNAKFASVCCEHFSQDSYQRDLENELLCLPPRRKLKKDAVPTLNLVPIAPQNSKNKCNSDDNISSREKSIKEANMKSTRANRYHSRSTRKSVLERMNIRLPLKKTRKKSVEDAVENAKNNESRETHCNTVEENSVDSNSLSKEGYKTCNSPRKGSRKAMEESYKILEEKYKALEQKYETLYWQNKTSEWQNKTLEGQNKALGEQHKDLEEKYRTLEMNYMTEERKNKVLEKKVALSLLNIQKLCIKMKNDKLLNKTRQSSLQRSVMISKIKQIEQEQRDLVVKKLSKIFTPGQITLLFGYQTRVRWVDEDISNAITLRAISKKAYSYLRKKGYPFPGMTTLRKWISNSSNTKHQEVSFHYDNFNANMECQQ